MKKTHILAVFLILLLVLASCAESGDTVERFAEANPDNSGNIAIPGYETIAFKAGRKTQQVNLPNPAENAASFVITLVLDDEGTTLWTGRALFPGEAFTELTISKALDAGEYAATLHYDCFSLADHTQLNGAEIKLTIHAQ